MSENRSEEGMDIVEQLLRQADADDKAGTLYAHEIGREAAAEIERLRKRCAPSKVVMIGGVGHYVSEAVSAEIEHLREALKPFAAIDLLERHMLTDFAMYVLRARSVLTPNAELKGGGE